MSNFYSLLSSSFSGLPNNNDQEVELSEPGGSPQPSFQPINSNISSEVPIYLDQPYRSESRNKSSYRQSRLEESLLRDAPLTRGIFMTYFIMWIGFILSVSFVSVAMVITFILVSDKYQRILYAPFLIVYAIIFGLGYKLMIELMNSKYLMSS